MKALPQTADVVVIGGGVMGASIAYHLVQRGVKKVVLLEKEPFFGAMSTGQCAGGIRHQFSSAINIELSKVSLAQLDRFAEEMDQKIDLRWVGYLFLLTDQEDVTMFRENERLQHQLGIDTQWLSPEDIRRLVPQVNSDGVLAGTFYDKDGLADPSSVVAGYIKNARRLGAKLFNGVEVTSIDLKGGAVSRIHTNKGDIATPAVVDACGAWAPQTAAMVGIDLPIVPIRRQIVVTTPLPELDPRFPFVLFFREALYFHPEGRGLLTGKSNPNETPGYKLNVDQEWEMIHMEEAMYRLPLLEKAGLLSHWAGLYEVTPDAQAIVGAVPNVPGFYVAAGFSGHGFMHGPVIGLLMAEEILDGRAHTVNIDPFRFDRFLTGKELKAEYNVV